MTTTRPLPRNKPRKQRLIEAVRCYHAVEPLRMVGVLGLSFPGEE